MTTRGEALLWLATAFLCATSTWVAQRRPVTSWSVPTLARVRVVHTTDTAVMQQEAERVIASDPFRWDRVPADVDFGSEPQSEVKTAPVSAPASFSLALRGIVGGPPWEALMEGLPGRSGPVLVRVGDKFGEVVVREIKRDSVVVQGPGNTWRLALAHTW